MPSTTGLEYVVERTETAPGLIDVALIRRSPDRQGHGLPHRREPASGTVLFHRSFRAQLDRAAIEEFAATLAQVARHALDGTLGCFVETSSSTASVEIALYERWFDGDRLYCEDLARRVFDPDDDAALVRAGEFRAELEAWAQRRNDESEGADLDVQAQDAATTARPSEHDAAAVELARILARDSAR